MTKFNNLIAKDQLKINNLEIEESLILKNSMKGDYLKGNYLFEGQLVYLNDKNNINYQKELSIFIDYNKQPGCFMQNLAIFTFDGQNNIISEISVYDFILAYNQIVNGIHRNIDIDDSF